MALKSYNLEHAPSPKDSSRYKLSLAGSEEDVKKLVDKLSGISSRPFPAPDRAFDWSIYLYELNNGLKTKLSAELDRVTLAASGGAEPQVEVFLSDGNEVPVTAAPKAMERGSLLSDNYTFETFVVGNNTRFTYAACKAVAENPGKSYNPLFIYGGVGLGKTHLMQAIGNYVREKFPNSNIVSTNTQEFINTVVEAIEKNTMKEIRNRFRKIDLLLIDDIQFLEQSEATQEEFFHVFNAMHEVGKQIVMTSDKPPKKLVTLEDRLKSRFEWGLTTDIKTPNLDTRKAILKRKSEQASLELPDDVCNYIAERLTANIRELEGIINRISAYRELSQETITLELVRDIIKNIISDEVDEEEKEETGEQPQPSSAAPPAPAVQQPPPPPALSPGPPHRAPFAPPPAAHMGGCPMCTGPLTFVHQYQRWYCPACRSYTEPARQYAPQYPPPPEYGYPEPGPPPRSCSRCGTPSRYIRQYERYYCDSCAEYIPDMESVPPPSAPAKEEPKPPKNPEAARTVKPEAKKVESAEKAPAPEETGFENRIIGQEKENIREIRVGYFMQEGSEEVLSGIVGKLRKLAEQKKFNFFIRPLFVHKYGDDSNLNYEKLAHLAVTNSVDIAICMMPPEDSEVPQAEFREKVGQAMETAGMPCDILSHTEIKESDALNLMLDIAICAKKR